MKSALQIKCIISIIIIIIIIIIICICITSYWINEHKHVYLKYDETWE